MCIRDRRNPTAFFIALAVSGAAHAKGGIQLDIPIRAAGYGMAFYEESAQMFESARPGTKVRVYGDPRIDDRISVRVLDGNFPDAAFAPYVLWPALIRAGKVLDLTPYLQGPNWEGEMCIRDRSSGGGGRRSERTRASQR